MQTRMLQVLRMLLGIILLLIGAIGLMLPLLQGWFFIFAGILVISPKNGKKIIAKIKAKIERFRRPRVKKGN